MIYQADWLLSPDDPPLPGGWIQVEGNRILATGAAENIPPGFKIRKFPGCTLMPGLINAHCHLELTALHNRLPPGKSFPVWVEELRAFTAALDSENYRHSARKGVAQLLQGGTTTVVDVGNTGEALSVLSQSPLRSIALAETLGANPELADSRFTHACALAAQYPSTSRFQPGVAAHAAYSCSPKLLAAIIRHQREANLPFTLHASESREETELFDSASGSLQEYCRGIYPGSPEHHHTTPIRWLDSLDLLPDHALIVHGNHLDELDIQILLRRKATVVHCPSSHAFFGHKPFPYSELRKAGVPVCLGTDSLASGDSLSMMEQMRLFRKKFPEVSEAEALRVATVAAAEVMRMGNELGRLKAGYKADFIVVRDSEVLLSVIDGKPASTL